MPKYMLLLHDDPSGFTSIGPAEMQRIIEKYAAWGNRLRQAGVLVGGDKLADEPGRLVRGKGAQRVTDGPYSETKEVLGGYYTIKASSYDEAVDRVRDCPHLEYGGTIEIRQIEDMTPQ